MADFLEFPLNNGAVAHIKQRCRNTVLARFKETHPSVVDEIIGLVRTDAKAIEINTQIAEMAMKGLGVEDIEAVMKFLSQQINHFDGLVDNGDEVDWKALGVDERIEKMDLLLSTLEIISVFLSVWLRYQGISAVARRG